MAADGILLLNLHLEAGSEPLDRLIAGVENGLLVTLFDYLNGLLRAAQGADDRHDPRRHAAADPQGSSPAA